MSSSPPIPPAEWKRKAVHAGMGLFALTLRWLDWKVAALFALLALLASLFLLPRFGRGLYRDRARKRDLGIVAYPAMVLALILLFRGPYLPIAAAVWAMMAFGDPAASVAGKTLGGPTLPWNREKTWTGVLSNWALGGISAVLVFWFVAARPLEPLAVSILIAGAGVYALLESVRAGIDDNFVAPVPTALVVFQLNYLSNPELSLLEPGFSRRALLSAAVNVAAAFLTWKIGLVRRSGAVSGAIVGMLVAAFGGWSAYAILWAFFLIGTAATRWGYRKKLARGVAEPDSGRRGASHVLANCLVATAVLLLFGPAIAFAGALAAALADTLGTEVGGLYGRGSYSPLRLTRLPPGRQGAVSWPGTLAGLLGATFLAAVAALLGLIPASGIAVVGAAGFLASFGESVASDFCRERGLHLDHDFANGLNTFLGAVIALELSLSLDSGRLYPPVAGI